jgi:hypothetical protein
MSNKLILPLQPIYKDEYGTMRFKENAIVRYLLDNGGIDMNKLASLSFPQTDREQFASLIGYSLSGFSELSYVSDESYAAAESMSKGEIEVYARNKELRDQLDRIREGLRIAIPAAFRIHPDDLQT